MAIERERRYLLKSIPFFNGPVAAKHLRQVYFPVGDPNSESLRIRTIGGESYFLTGKLGSGESRDEREFDLNSVPGLGEYLMSRLKIEITKLRIKRDGWEIDIYDHPLAGIYLAEIEFKDREPDPPDWLKPFILRDVTDSLNNYMLALLASEIRGLDISPFLYVNLQTKRIPRVVITGGPGSGKSTIMEILKSLRPDLHLVPEVATILMRQVGLSPAGGMANLARFQKFVFATQVTFEDASTAEAKMRNKIMMITDRGVVDSVAYLPNGADDFRQILNCDPESQLSRYDAVVCLAVPPKDVFGEIKGNNPNRSESWEGAMDLDRRTREAWEGHHNFHYIDNSGGWDKKVSDVMSLIDFYVTYNFSSR
jgi:CYTH domain-containing protein/predicted ATPase